MRVTDVAEHLTKTLGVYVSPNRITMLEKRGIIEIPKLVDGIREYSAKDIERLRHTVLFTELGVPLKDVRLHFMKLPNDVFVKAGARIHELKRIIAIATKEFRLDDGEEV